MLSVRGRGAAIPAGGIRRNCVAKMASKGSVSTRGLPASEHQKQHDLREPGHAFKEVLDILSRAVLGGAGDHRGDVGREEPAGADEPSQACTASPPVTTSTGASEASIGNRFSDTRATSRHQAECRATGHFLEEQQGRIAMPTDPGSAIRRSSRKAKNTDIGSLSPDPTSNSANSRSGSAAPARRRPRQRRDRGSRTGQ
jgi:hypothetical protein